ncbi:MAG TPA: histidine kinase dimerization/phospho-acceptor domain-containing protein [Polyangia bacterium]|nr:histidine kinase dimerization/phospho-acceptor domain-containing protein [Polyangia bacterium]
MDSSFQELHATELLSQSNSPDNEQTRALLAELWAAGKEMEPESEGFAAAVTIGAAAFEAGEDPGALVDRILRLGSTLADSALQGGALDHSGARRLERAAGRAAAVAVSAYARTGHEHREAWLSFLCHDLKNPLNTLLNALWLIREHRASGNIDRFIELAERAVRRMEGGIKDVRDLQQKERVLPRRK